MRRLFCIWNRSYSKQYVIASDADEALALSLAAGHFKRPQNYRKFEDVTEESSDGSDLPDICKLIAMDVSGVAQLTVEGWSINGKPITD